MQTFKSTRQLSTERRKYNITLSDIIDFSTLRKSNSVVDIDEVVENSNKSVTETDNFIADIMNLTNLNIKETKNQIFAQKNSNLQSEETVNSRIKNTILNSRCITSYTDIMTDKNDTQSWFNE